MVIDDEAHRVKIVRRTALEQATMLAGSESALARMTGYTQNAIWAAKQRNMVTPEMALAIHHALHGAVSAHELRPDIWPTAESVPGE